MTPDTDTEARAAAEAYAKAWSDPDAQTWVIEAFLAGRARGWREGLEKAERIVTVGAGGFDMSYMECVEAIRAAAKGEGK